MFCGTLNADFTHTKETRHLISTVLNLLFPFLLAYSLIRAELAEAFIVWYAFQIQIQHSCNFLFWCIICFFHPSFINASHLSGFYQSTWSMIKRSHALPSCWPCPLKICAAGFRFLYTPRVFPVSRCECKHFTSTPQSSLLSLICIVGCLWVVFPLVLAALVFSWVLVLSEGYRRLQPSVWTCSVNANPVSEI